MMRLILALAFAFMAYGSFSQVSDDACNVMKNATKLHEIGDPDLSSYYTVDGEWYYDFSNEGKYYIKSRIEWQDDCTYMLTLMETNIPNFEIPYGTKLRVQITGVEGNEVSYEYLPKGILPGGKMRIIE